MAGADDEGFLKPSGNNGRRGQSQKLGGFGTGGERESTLGPNPVVARISRPGTKKPPAHEAPAVRQIQVLGD
jgi:hypothetical protein